MLKIGCSGWPVRRCEYFRRFSAVEISTSFYNLPLLATAGRWKEESPEGFDFCLKAWQLVTHTSSSPTYRRLSAAMSDRRLAQCGHFKGTDEVLSAWQRTLAVARALGARCILFQTPKTFTPQADHLRDMYRFFKAVARGKMLFAWEPRGASWRPEVVARVSSDLGLIRAGQEMPADSSAERGAKAGKTLHYWRFTGTQSGAAPAGRADALPFSDEALVHLRDRLAHSTGYVFFATSTMWDDARRFQANVRRDTLR